MSKGSLRTSVSLTDPVQRAAARRNPLEWLRSLPQPFAIDEAQLAPELPVALKRLLDETGDNLRCVLTGSAAIGRTGLGGTDPLARRSVRLALEPLTEAELINTTPWSVVDQLFDGQPAAGASSAPVDWRDHIVRGGLPRYRVGDDHGSTSWRRRRLLADVDSILTNDVLPDVRFDLRTARDVVQRVLRTPSGEVKAASIGSALELDARTVNRYLDIAERRFLLHELPNFRQSIRQSARTTAKIYPADVALSAALLLQGEGSFDDDRIRGGLMEAHVVQQIRAHVAWSSARVTAFHWRESRNGRTDEVDVILEDERGRLVAVEVKSAASSRHDDFRGIRAFQDKFPDRFHRGYVVVTEGTPTNVGPNLWTLPIASLQSQEFWTTSTSSAPAHSAPISPNRATSNPPMPTDARVFMSYTHADQNSAYAGDLQQFARDVVDTLDGIHGRTAELFIDQDDGRWGEDLWARLEAELESATFFLPFITPRYLKSESCRHEFTRFLDAAERAGAPHLMLPLLWIAAPAMPASTNSDVIAQRLQRTRHIDATAARTGDRSSVQYRQLVEQAADQLAQVMSEREAAPTREGTPLGPVEDVDVPALDDTVVEIEDLIPAVESALETFLNRLTVLGSTMETALVIDPSQSPRLLRQSLTTAARALQAPSSELTEASGIAIALWQDLMSKLNALAQISRDLGEPVPAEIMAEIEQFADEMTGLDTAELALIASQMPRLSSHLAPAARSLNAAVATVKTMGQSAQAFVDAQSAENN
ncbi:MAG: DUF4143 domain-containing protein [Actinomycetota bacterium]|nr:DUF4143 domain-containing protein [Actinomycetota bacterium]